MQRWNTCLNLHRVNRRSVIRAQPQSCRTTASTQRTQQQTQRQSNSHRATCFRHYIAQASQHTKVVPSEGGPGMHVQASDDICCMRTHGVIATITNIHSMQACRVDLRRSSAAQLLATSENAEVAGEKTTAGRNFMRPLSSEQRRALAAPRQQLRPFRCLKAML